MKVTLKNSLTKRPQVLVWIADILHRHDLPRRRICSALFTWGFFCLHRLDRPVRKNGDITWGYWKYQHAKGYIVTSYRWRVPHWQPTWYYSYSGSLEDRARWSTSGDIINLIIPRPLISTIMKLLGGMIFPATRMESRAANPHMMHNDAHQSLLNMTSWPLGMKANLCTFSSSHLPDGKE